VGAVNPTSGRRRPLWRGQADDGNEDAPPLDSFFFAPLETAAAPADAGQEASGGGTEAAAGVVGWVCMQALQDGLLLDLPLAPPLLDLLARGHRCGAHPLLGSRAAALRALAAVDGSMARQLAGLLALAASHTAAGNAATLSRAPSVATPPGSAGGDGASVDDDPVAALELGWTLPGRPDVALFPHAGDRAAPPAVTSASVGQWVASVLHATLLGPSTCGRAAWRRCGDNPVVAALRQGADRVASPACLTPFSGSELAALLTGDGCDDDDDGDGDDGGSEVNGEPAENDMGGLEGGDGGVRGRRPLGRSPAAILAALECAHGYDRRSASVHHLAAALANWGATDQRLFVRFATGSPRLPRGGLAKLRPRLTVVKASGASAQHLPSAATCTHYLKLPDYPTSALLEQRLRTAVREGQGAFFLS
jgi:E3 ubiquitin-protein ligase TRIP12